MEHLAAKEYPDGWQVHCRACHKTEWWAAIHGCDVIRQEAYIAHEFCPTNGRIWDDCPDCKWDQMTKVIPRAKQEVQR